MHRSLIYVSRQAFAPSAPEQVIDDIVTKARTFNAANGITGALACTREHFAQLLEGPGLVLEQLMHRIEQDPRHTDVTTLRVSDIALHRLPDWSMAYSGPSSYVARQIEPLIGRSSDATPGRVDRLISLLVGLATVD